MRRLIAQFLWRFNFFEVVFGKNLQGYLKCAMLFSILGKRKLLVQ